MVVGTVATAVLEDVRLIAMPPAGAGPDKFRARFCVAPFITDAVGFANAMLPVTDTLPLFPLKPGADALIVAVPKFTPVTCGCVAGVFCPAAIETVTGDTLAVVGLLLESDTVMPPGGAGVARVTANGALCPRPRLTPVGTVIAPKSDTVTPKDPGM